MARLPCAVPLWANTVGVKFITYCGNCKIIIPCDGWIAVSMSWWACSFECLILIFLLMAHFTNSTTDIFCSDLHWWHHKNSKIIRKDGNRCLSLHKKSKELAAAGMWWATESSVHMKGLHPSHWKLAIRTQQHKATCSRAALGVEISRWKCLIII